MPYEKWEEVKPQEGKQTQAFNMIGDVDFMLWGGARFGGKALPLSSTVLTYRGHVKVGDLLESDLIFSPLTGEYINLLKLHPVTPQEVVRFHFADGSSVDSSPDHQWLARRSSKSTKSLGKRLFGKDSRKVVSTKDITTWVDRLGMGKGNHYPLLPATSPAQLPKRELLVDPYLMGLLLGDGCITERANLTITTVDSSIVDYVTSRWDVAVDVKTGTEAVSLRFRGKDLITLKTALMCYGLYGCDSKTKFIPEDYLLSDLDDRYSLIQGLMDTDGSAYTAGRVTYTSCSEKLVDGTNEVLQSLGCITTTTSKIPFYRDKSGEKVYCNRSYNLNIKSESPKDLFRLERKKALAKPSSLCERKVVSYEILPEVPMRCITVDSKEGLFVTGRNYVVTHNSELLSMVPLLFADDPNYRGIFFRRQYDEIMGSNGLWEKAENMYPLFQAEPRISKKRWDFPCGARQVYAHMFTEADKESHRGKGYSLIGFDEIDQFSESQVQFLMTTLRSEASMDSFCIGTLI